jgi:hypothetical protein
MEVSITRESEGTKTCDILGCDRPAERSLSAKKVEKAGLDIEDVKGKVHLCKDHYKEYKKASRTDRKLETLGR